MRSTTPRAVPATVHDPFFNHAEKSIHSLRILQTDTSYGPTACRRREQAPSWRHALWGSSTATRNQFHRFQQSAGRNLRIVPVILSIVCSHRPRTTESSSRKALFERLRRRVPTVEPVRQQGKHSKMGQYHPTFPTRPAACGQKGSGDFFSPHVDATAFVAGKPGEKRREPSFQGVSSRW